MEHHLAKCKVHSCNLPLLYQDGWQGPGMLHINQKNNFEKGLVNFDQIKAKVEFNQCLGGLTRLYRIGKYYLESSVLQCLYSSTSASQYIWFLIN